jgi:hypothetical protein
MHHYFLYFFLFVLSFYGAEIKGLENGLIYTNELMVFFSLCFLIITFVEYLKNRSARDGPGKSEIFLFLFLIWSAATFFFSVNSDLSLFPAMKTLGGIAFGLGLFLYLKESSCLNKIWLISFIFAGIHATSGIIQKFFPLFSSEFSHPFLNAQSIFNSSNFYSCFLIIHIPIGLYLFFAEKRDFTKMLIGLSWICILVALGFSNSLAAQLIAGMQLFALVIYYGILKNVKIIKLTSWAVMGAIIIYLGLYKFIGNIEQVSHITSIKPPLPTPVQPSVSWYDEHVLPRIVYAWGGWKIFTEHWLAGSGLWTYRDLYPFTGLLEAYPNTKFIVREPQHAHSFYFQTAGETGIIGLILIGGNIFYLFLKNIKTLVRERAKKLDFQFILLVSISGFLIHNIGEYNWLYSNFIYYYIFLIVSIGFLERENVFQDPKVSTPIRKPVFIPIMLVSIMVIGWSTIYYINYNEILLKKTLASKSYIEMEKVLTQAKNICERCGMPHYLLGIAHIEEAKKITRLRNVELVNKAEREFSEVLVRNPYSSRVYLAHGDVSRLLQRKKKALQSYQMAMRDLKYKEIAFKRIEDLRMAE